MTIQTDVPLRLGDYVEIPNTTYPPGRIVEARGPLGPGGAQVFRVRVGEKADPVFIELREDQLRLRHKVTTVTFAQLLHRVRRRPVDPAGTLLTFPNRPDPFVPQTATAEEFPAGQDPLASDVLLFTAPAAVGKSTFARALAAEARIPILDLSKVGVASGSLSGILDDELDDSATRGLLTGEFALIVDALDEGRMFSGENNVEQFLETAVKRLNGRTVVKGNGPKVLFFGRPDAVQLVADILELHAPELPVTHLTLDYFDQKAATELVLATARKMGDPDTIEKYDCPIRKVIRAFFDAISTAINIDPKTLWDDRRGQSFAGYSPVLASLGTLIAGDKVTKETPNYLQLRLRLEQAGMQKAWNVLEMVADEILEREAEKVRGPLVAKFGADIPVEAYDQKEQLDLLTALLVGETRSPSSRVVFGAPDAAAAYKKAVEVHRPEHPFLYDKKPVNDVLGALVIADALAQGKSLAGGQGPRLLARYGRQPFLWRFIRHRLANAGDTVIAGETVSYLLGSLWADDTSPRAEAAIHSQDGGGANFTIRTADTQAALQVFPPLILMGDVRNLDVELPEDEVHLNGWPESKTSSISFLGRARIRARRIVFNVQHIHVGALGHSATCHLNAEDAVNDWGMAPPVVHPGSEITIQGVFEKRPFWQQLGTVVRSSGGGDALADLLAACEQRLQNVMSLVTYPTFELTDDERVDWARKYDLVLPRLLRALVRADLATTHVIQTKKDTKIRVSPRVSWREIRQAYERPGQANPVLRNVLEAVRKSL